MIMIMMILTMVLIVILIMTTESQKEWAGGMSVRKGNGGRKYVREGEYKGERS